MWRQIRWQLIGCGLTAVGLVACSEKVSPTAATLEGNIYKNRFFNFQVRIPEGWTLGDKRDYDEASAARNPGRNPKRKQGQVMENAFSHVLLMAMETPITTPAESHPSFILATANVRSHPRIQSGKDYELEMIEKFKRDGDERELLHKPSLTKLGAKEFFRVDFKVGVLDRTIQQAFFATVEKGHVLMLAVTADSEADVNTLLTTAGFPQAGE